MEKEKNGVLFQEKLMEKLKGKKDDKTVVERAYRRANSVVKQQIAALEFRRTELECKAEEKQELLENATYCDDFSIKSYDLAKSEFDAIEEELADVEATLESRRELLNRWG